MDANELKNLNPGQLIRMGESDIEVITQVHVHGVRIMSPLGTTTLLISHLEDIEPLDIHLTQRGDQWFQLSGDYMARLQCMQGKWWFIHAKPTGHGYDNPTLDQMALGLELDLFLVRHAKRMEGKSFDGN